MKFKSIQLVIFLFLIILFFGGCASGPKSFKDRTLDDMYVILTKDQYKKLKSLETDEAIYKFLDEFWATMDPIPDTKENELKDEYQQRLKYANENFEDRKGWGRSDRKKIYLLYGAPTYIERKEYVDVRIGTFSSMKSIEIWYYSSPAKNFVTESSLDVIETGERSFVFAEVNGIGVYELLKSTEDISDIDARLLNKF